jgi:hypothetical protein
LNRGDQALFTDGLRVVEDTGFALAEGDRGHLYAGLLLYECLDVLAQ